MNNTTQTAKDDDENGPKLEGEEFNQALKKQLEYYFSKENLLTDRYLLSQMNADLNVPIKTISNFKLIKQFTSDIELIVKILKDIPSVVVDETETFVRPNIKSQRNTIILREIPSSTNPAEIKELFNNDKAGKVVGIKPDVGDCWYVTLEDDESAVSTIEYLKTQTFNGQPVKARLKTESTLKSLISFAPVVLPGQQYHSNWDPSHGQEYKRGGQQSHRRPRSYSARASGGGRQKGHDHKGTGKGEQKDAGGRKRRESGGSLIQLGPQHFPPLPTKEGSKKRAGYLGDYIKISKQQMIDIISSLKKSELTKPNIPIDCRVSRDNPDLEILVAKPWPKKITIDIEPLKETDETKNLSAILKKEEIANIEQPI